MALFTNIKDAGLPILTQVYQAETAPPYTEVQFLYERWKDARDPEFNDLDIDKIRHLAAGFNILRYLMKDVWEGPGFREWVGIEASDFLEGKHWRGIQLTNKEKDENGRFKVGAFQETYGGYFCKVLGMLADEMHSLIIQSDRQYQGEGKQTILACCEECNSIFMIRFRHPHQKNCSNRCIDRAASRRRRDQIKTSTGLKVA